MSDAIALADAAAPSDTLGLTPVHIAVLRDDLGQLFSLIQAREFGVNALDARRATPIMLAAIAGRSTAFTFLLENGASLRKEDAHGLTATDYLRAANMKSLIQKYQPHTRKRFSERRRKLIRSILRAFNQSTRQESAQDTATQALAPPGPIQAANQVPVASPAITEAREVIIHQDKAVIFGKLSVQIKADCENDTHNKTMAAIRGRAEGSPFHVMAISGWRGDKAEGMPIICNSKYTALTRATSHTFGVVLRGHPVDCHFQGSVEENFGRYLCCHAERQLATWLVEECIFRALGNREITVENVAKLKQKVDLLPADLRETVIELGHMPCRWCIEYIDLLQKKSGLVMALNPRAWFVPGKRTTLRLIDPSLKQDFQDRRVSSSRAGIFINELGDDSEMEDTEDEPTTDLPSSLPTSESQPRASQASRPASKQALLAQKAVNTQKYRQGPPVWSDPSEADAESSEQEPALADSSGTSSAPGTIQDASPPSQPLPSIHKRRASVSSGAIEPASSPRPSRPATPSSEERARKRQKLLRRFKDVVIEFAHVSPQRPPREGSSEDGLAQTTINEPFPGAAAFGLDDNGSMSNDCRH